MKQKVECILPNAKHKINYSAVFGSNFLLLFFSFPLIEFYVFRLFIFCIPCTPDLVFACNTNSTLYHHDNIGHKNTPSGAKLRINYADIGTKKEADK